MTRHPPLKKGEHFLGNTRDGIPQYLLGVVGLELRRPAYDINGVKLELPYKALIAIDGYAAARYNRIMEEQLTAIKRGYKV